MPVKKANSGWRLSSAITIALVLIGAISTSAVALHRIDKLEMRVEASEKQRQLDHDLLIRIGADTRHMKETLDDIQGHLHEIE